MHTLLAPSMSSRHARVMCSLCQTMNLPLKPNPSGAMKRWEIVLLSRIASLMALGSRGPNSTSYLFSLISGNSGVLGPQSFEIHRFLRGGHMQLLFYMAEVESCGFAFLRLVSHNNENFRESHALPRTWKLFSRPFFRVSWIDLCKLSETLLFS